MANFTERLGVHHCGEIAEKNNWLFRETPTDDIGIDAYMESVESDGKSRQLIALQIKSGASWFRKGKDNCICFRDINERQYNYWTSYSLPCIVVLYNPEDNMCIWQKLTVETISRTRKGKGKGFYVNVPINQVFLDDLSNSKLLSFSNLPEYITNYNFLISQKRFMQIVRDGGIVKLHSKEWVNKCSGRGSTELIVNNGGKSEKYNYPYWFPYTSYTDVFPRLFPWASFTADEDFFEEEDEALWREYHCYYDRDQNEWVNVGETFDEFRKKLDPMRCIDHAGEVAEYMMILSLNELGESFLRVDSFVSENRPYSSARPEEKYEKD